VSPTLEGWGNAQNKVTWISGFAGVREIYMSVLLERFGTDAYLGESSKKYTYHYHKNNKISPLV